jgi:peptidoglycan hydrolase CwlO-like protein
MNIETTLTEPDLPQLRQVVLENTRQIFLNKQAIDRMRMELTEQAQKNTVRDEWLENSRREFERFRKESREDFYRDLKESRKEFDKRMEVLEKQIKETGEQIKETGEQIKETGKQIRETGEQIKETGKQIRETGEQIREMIRETNEQIRETGKQIREAGEQIKETGEQIKETTRETNEQIRETGEQIRKTGEQIKETTRETNEQIRETGEQIRKTGEQIRETIRETIKETLRETKRETDEQIKETEKQLKETSLEVKQFFRQLTGTTGHIVEGLVSSSTEKIFKKAGFELHNSGKNLKRKLTAENIAMEVDVLLSNEKTAIPIEVKTNFTKDNVIRFLHQMSLFRKLFPEFADMEVLAAVAAINYEKDVAEFARSEGLLVIRVNSDDIFSIDPFEADKLHRF